MEARLDYAKLAPDAIRALYSLGAYLAKSGLEHPLLELVKIRASQINGCAYCIDMHTKDARAAGETEQRIYALSAWRETPFFSDRERAARVRQVLDHVPQRDRIDRPRLDRHLAKPGTCHVEPESVTGVVGGMRRRLDALDAPSSLSRLIEVVAVCASDLQEFASSH